jgi:signal recognition particle subunit SRP54
MEAARLGGYDVVMLDTAGRVTVDEALMAEAAEVRSATNPHEVLLVADALTGQDAVNTARAFDQRLGVTGIVLTRMDGDARGGAALSMRAVTGKPIKLIGTGEKVDALEEFHPSRVANRILGMGDIVSLVERAAENFDQAQAQRMADKMRKGKFDLEDLRDQLSPNGKARRPRRADGHAARRGQDEVAAGERQSRRPGDQAPARHHRFHDAGRAPQPGHPQGLA